MDIDASTQVDIALGLQTVDGTALPTEQKVRIVRRLLREKFTRVLRSFHPVADLLTMKSGKFSYTARRIPSDAIVYGMNVDSVKMLSIYSSAVWQKDVRHDEIIYLTATGALVLWEGTCRIGSDRAEEYENLKLTELSDETLASFIGNRPDFFSDFMNSLRILIQDSIKVHGNELKDLYDGVRLTTETQRRLRILRQDE